MTYEEKIRLAIDPSTSGQQLMLLAKDEDWKVRAAVAMHADCPPKALVILAKDKEWDVRYGVAKNPNCPLKVLAFLAKDNNWAVRAAVARHADCPIDILTILAKDGTWQVREAVAKNPNCPPKVLTFLAKDSNWDVREAAKSIAKKGLYQYDNAVHESKNSMNRKTNRLMEAGNKVNKYELARSSSTPAHILSELVNDEDPQIRVFVASNDSCPPEAFFRLAKDPVMDVRWYVAHNYNCPSKVLALLAKDEHASVRREVAGNPNCPPKIREFLSKDSNKEVRYAAEYTSTKTFNPTAKGNPWISESRTNRLMEAGNKVKTDDELDFLKKAIGQPEEVQNDELANVDSADIEGTGSDAPELNVTKGTPKLNPVSQDAIDQSRRYLDAMNGDLVEPDEISDEEAYAHRMSRSADIPKNFDGYIDPRTILPNYALLPKTIVNDLANINHSLQQGGVDAPKWYTIPQLPGYLQNQIRAIGRATFKLFTTTSIEEVCMISTITNTAAELTSVVLWLKKNAKNLGKVNLDFGKVMPGYHPEACEFSTPNTRFLVIQDHMGYYIYAYPEKSATNKV